MSLAILPRGEDQGFELHCVTARIGAQDLLKVAVKGHVHLQRVYSPQFSDNSESIAIRTPPVSVFGLLLEGDKSSCVDVIVRTKK
jgi:hypothetical protein